MGLITPHIIETATNATLGFAPVALAALQPGLWCLVPQSSRGRAAKGFVAERAIHASAAPAAAHVLSVSSPWRSPNPLKQPTSLAGLFWLSSQHARANTTAAVPGQDAPLSEVVSAVLSCAEKSETAEPGLLAQLASCAADKAGELSPEEIRNLLVSFASLNYSNMAFKSAMADAIVDKITEFEPSALADAAWAFGQAEYYDFDLLSHLIPYMKQNAERFDASSMAKMLWLFGRAGYQDGVLMDMMHDVALKLHDKMDTTAIAEVVFAEAQMGWADPRVQSLVGDYATDNIQAFDSGSLAKLAYGLTAVGYEDDTLYRLICERAQELLLDMRPSDVALVMWALGEQAFWHKEFLSELADGYLPNKLSTFTPQQLKTVVVAFNKLGFSSPGVAQAAMELAEALPGLAPEFPGAENTTASAVLK